MQVDVKHVKLISGRLYPFTAIDEATCYQVLKISDHNRNRSAIDPIGELRKRLSVAIKRIQRGSGSEFGSPFTWHIEDLGIKHEPVPVGRPEANGKVERYHRTDEDEFYGRFTFRGASALQRMLRKWETEYNEHRPHQALKGSAPAERLLDRGVRPLPAVGLSA